MSMDLMILAADARYAAEAQDAGIDRIFYDLEYINKHERQRGMNTVISNNNIENIPGVKKVLNAAKLLVRTNPVNENISHEIERVIEYGADIVMLPMAVDHLDVEKYVGYVDQKAKVSIMIETAQALTRIDSILDVDGIDEVFIGLNDLHIGLDLEFMFEVLSGGLIDYLGGKCLKKGIPFGFGGIARIGDGLLKSDWILGEHYRLGSTAVILSRAFKGDVGKTDNRKPDLKAEVEKLRNKEYQISLWPPEEYELNRKRVQKTVMEIVCAQNGR